MAHCVSDRSMPWPISLREKLNRCLIANGGEVFFCDPGGTLSVKKEADSMAEKQPSKQKQEAAAAQSLADRTGIGKEEARRMQSEADKSEVIKHGQ